MHIICAVYSRGCPLLVTFSSLLMALFQKSKCYSFCWMVFPYLIPSPIMSYYSLCKRSIYYMGVSQCHRHGNCVLASHMLMCAFYSVLQWITRCSCNFWPAMGVSITPLAARLRDFCRCIQALVQTGVLICGTFNHIKPPGSGMFWRGWVGVKTPCMTTHSNFSKISKK